MYDLVVVGGGTSALCFLHTLRQDWKLFQNSRIVVIETANPGLAKDNKDSISDYEKTDEVCFNQNVQVTMQVPKVFGGAVQINGGYYVRFPFKENGLFSANDYWQICAEIEDYDDVVRPEVKGMGNADKKISEGFCDVLSTQFMGPSLLCIPGVFNNYTNQSFRPNVGQYARQRSYIHSWKAWNDWRRNGKGTNKEVDVVYATVSTVCFEGDRAIGVELEDGKIVNGKHIFLFAGAINTPRILLRSARKLVSLHKPISGFTDNANIGVLHDHVLLGFLSYKLDPGSVCHGSVMAGAWIGGANKDALEDHPDIELQCWGRDNFNPPSVRIAIIFNHGENVGRVLLDHIEYTTKPFFDRARQWLLQFLKSMRRFPLALLADDSTFNPMQEYDGESLWQAYTEAKVCPSYLHMVASTRFSSVVDDNLRVKGCQNLFIGDNGIFPYIAPGHTQFTAFFCGKLLAKLFSGSRKKYQRDTAR